MPKYASLTRTQEAELRAFVSGYIKASNIYDINSLRSKFEQYLGQSVSGHDIRQAVSYNIDILLDKHAKAERDEER